MHYKRPYIRKTQMCYEKHPPLEFRVPSTFATYRIYGGSCVTPAVLDATLYLGLDVSMTVTGTKPWDLPSETVRQVLYPIPDMSVPLQVEEFKKMIEWVATRIVCGDKVHVGCLGGHGRTGMVLVALYTVLTGNKDGIDFVRKNYCTEAVETSQQEVFLMSVYGCDAPTIHNPNHSLFDSFSQFNR